MREHQVPQWVSPDGHSELVFNSNHELVTDPANMGTYNFGTSDASHFFEDMVPYWRWGNTPDDPTTFLNRIYPFDVLAADNPWLFSDDEDARA